MKKNLGFSFTNVKGIQIDGRSLGAACGCKRKCRSLLMNNEQKIFNEFWNLGNKNAQDQYLFNLIKSVPILRRYKTKTKKEISSRLSSFNYHICVNSKLIIVCKAEFLAVHGLQDSKARIHRILAKISEGKAIPPIDMRGRHHNRKNAFPSELVDAAKRHIESIPTYSSHYSRKRNPNRKYFDVKLTVSKLYSQKYLPWCTENNVLAISEDKYRRLFRYSYDIGFKLPKSDATCETCDKLNIEIVECDIEDDIKKETLTANKELHLKHAECMQSSLVKEVAKAKETENIDVICFDLHQTFPTPLLSVDQAFYLRKSWTYNLGNYFCHTQNVLFFNAFISCCFRNSRLCG